MSIIDNLCPKCNGSGFLVELDDMLGSQMWPCDLPTCRNGSWDIAPAATTKRRKASKVKATSLLSR